MVTTQPHPAVTQEPRFVAPPSQQIPVLLDAAGALVLDRNPPAWAVEVIEALDADTNWHQGAGVPLLEAVLNGEPMAAESAGDAVWAHIQRERSLLRHGGAVTF